MQRDLSATADLLVIYFVYQVVWPLGAASSQLPPVFQCPFKPAFYIYTHTVHIMQYQNILYTLQMREISIQIIIIINHHHHHH